MPGGTSSVIVNNMFYHREVQAAFFSRHTLRRPVPQRKAVRHHYTPTGVGTNYVCTKTLPLREMRTHGAMVFTARSMWFRLGGHKDTYYRQ